MGTWFRTCGAKISLYGTFFALRIFHMLFPVESGATEHAADAEQLGIWQAAAPRPLGGTQRLRSGRKRSLKPTQSDSVKMHGVAALPNRAAVSAALGGQGACESGAPGRRAQPLRLPPDLETTNWSRTSSQSASSSRRHGAC